MKTFEFTSSGFKRLALLHQFFLNKAYVILLGLFKLYEGELFFGLEADEIILPYFLEFDHLLLVGFEYLFVFEFVFGE